MSERLEEIKDKYLTYVGYTGNVKVNVDYDTLEWLIQRAKLADKLESIYRKDWIALINEAKEMGLSPEQVRKFLREGKK